MIATAAPLYLFAGVPADALGVLGDVGMPVASDRRHITMLDLSGIDLPQDKIVALVRRVMAVLPPFSFRVVFDQFVRSLRQTLLTATQPLMGAIGAQMQLRAALAGQGLNLPDAAWPRAHVTLGYGEDRAPEGSWPILPISWRVEALTLVRSHVRQSRHQPLARWRLPMPD